MHKKYTYRYALSIIFFPVNQKGFYYNPVWQARCCISLFSSVTVLPNICPQDDNSYYKKKSMGLPGETKSNAIPYRRTY